MLWNKLHILPALMLLGACFPQQDISIPGGSGGPGGSGSGGDGGGPGEPALDFVVESLSKDVGSNAGGLEVLIELSGDALPNNASPEVLFADVPAVVMAIGEHELIVTTPAYGGTGRVDLTVVVGDEEDSLPSAFNYMADATDQAILLLDYTEWKLANPGLWGSSENYYRRSIGFVLEPQDTWLRDFVADGWDSCELSSSPMLTLLDGGGALDVTAADLTVEVPWQPKFGYYYLFEGVDLLVTEGVAVEAALPETDAYPEMTSEGLGAVPSALQVVAPPIDSDSIQPVYGGSTVLEWTGSSGDYVKLDFYDLFSDAYAHCLVVDDGSFQVPAMVADGFYKQWNWDYFADFATVEVHVTSYVQGAVSMEFNNGEIRARLGRGEIGLIYLN